jgi:hypothetical protein
MSVTLQRLPKRGSATAFRCEIGSEPKTDSATELKREESAECFGRRFTHLEWKYLCSYRWFLKAFPAAVETNDFSLLQTKAEKALVRARLRGPAKTVTNDPSVCHSTEWYD